MWAIELVAKASSSRVVEAEKSTTDGVVIVERGTTEGVFDAEDTTEGVSVVSRLQREWVPGHQIHYLVDPWRFAPQVCFTYHSIILDYFKNLGQLHVFLLGVG